MFMLLMPSSPLPLVERLENRRRHADVIRRSLRRHYGTLDAACVDMGVKPSNLNAALDGDRGLPAGFLELPLGVLGWYGFYLLEEFGLPLEIKRGIRYAMAFTGARRMVSADLERESA